MSHNRLLILLGGCLLAASAAWADDVGYIDCSNHPEGTQVFAKARRSPDVAASLPCGERFAVLVYGFVFSRIETRDGKVGYIYSNLIAVDRAATAAQQSGSLRFAADKSSTPAPVVKPDAAAQPQAAPAQSAPAPVATSPTAKANVAETTAAVMQPNPPAPAQPQPTPAEPVPARASEPASPVATSPAATSNVPETAPAVVQPNPATPAQPESSPAQPAAPAVRPAIERTSWEKPLPTVRRTPLIELFGGYAFARMDGGGGPATNLNGALGSFGWNVKPWLQIVADSSYSVVTINGTKNVLYGNHYGPRYFHRGRNRWGITPFVEALFGASRADTTPSGAGGYSTSENSFSIKAGGGLDIHPSRRWEIRLLDVDYYRTSFGTNLHQNNYWASAGIVLRLFGGRNDY